MIQNLPGIQGGLVRFLTRDGLELHGILALPRARPRFGLLHIHGWEGNFYENRFIYAAAQACLERGVAFLAANNRGHDYIADILRPGKGEYVQLGGAYERLVDCVADIAAGLDLLAEHGCHSLLLQGHSHGAIKATHYLARTRDARVKGLVLLSPSDDLGLSRQQLGRRYGRALAIARRFVESGRGRELMPAWASPYFVSATGFLDACGPDSLTAMFNMARTDRQRFPELARIRVPVLAVAGTVTEAFVGDPHGYVAAVGRCLSRSSAVTTAVIDEAPHNYLGREAALGLVLGRWLDSIVRGRRRR